MSILTSILSPPFLVDNIELIAFIVSVMILVFFDDFVAGKVIFPIADFIKFKLAQGIDVVYEKREIAAKAVWAKYVRKYCSEAVATILVVFYCYVGYEILGIYVIEPLLQRWKGVITLIVLLMFLVVNYLVNNAKMRRRFFGFGICNPEKTGSKILKPLKT